MEDDYDTLCTFGNIPYTPAWYYKRFPGFFNVECYKILAAWEGGVPPKEEEDNIMTASPEDVVVDMDRFDIVNGEWGRGVVLCENKKRKLSSENSESENDELRSTIKREHP